MARIGTRMARAAVLPDRTGGGDGRSGGGGAPSLVPVRYRGLLVLVAEDAIRAVLEGRRWDPDPAVFPPELQRLAGCFVSLSDGPRTLGCVGTVEPTLPLVSLVADRARQAAFADPRFPPITADDFRRATIRVSVLHPSTPVQAGSVPELVTLLSPHVDGLVVSAPGHFATYLPDVWRRLPEPVAFVDGLWRKAGLRPGTWPPGIRVSRYRADSATGRPPRAAPDPIPVIPLR